MKVLVAGDLLVTTTFKIDRLPRAGSNVVSDGLAMYASGVAANIAWNLRGLGAEVAVLGAVGDDVFGRYILDDLTARGVDVDHVRALDAPTGMFTILLDDTGERTMIGHRGANERLTLDPAPILQWAPEWCHLSGYTLLNPHAVDGLPGFVSTLRHAGIRCSIDLEGIADTERRIDLSDVTALCNRDEYTRYFGHAPIDGVAADRRLQLVVKAGRDGCYAVEDGVVEHVSGFEAEIADCTGAGDAFNAGFIAARLRGLSQHEACVWGNAAASLKVALAGPRVDLSADRLRHVISHIG